MNSSQQPLWKTSSSLEELDHLCRLSFISHLGIYFTRMGNRDLEAEMVIQPYHLQPMGIVHGGVWAAFAETVASVAANLALDQNSYYAVGTNLTVNHLKSVSSGKIVAITSPDHIGLSTQVWSIQIQDENKRVIAVARLTVSNLKK
ncbi:PaaI family thioesterase [Rhabdochlamydiaceae symbiont of Dictyostelium giganteum]|uniref:PaaI family thioesterase n=1 Tax=Rhabdochlamydiaceae symbiont of Dictyostelium giganteum TaxID=3342349 RepID=UPI00384D81EF